MVDRKNYLKAKIGVPIVVAVVILILLFISMLMDSNQFQNYGGEPESNPYILLSSFEGDQFLVSDAVVEWLNGETNGEELYNKYSSKGRVYSAKPVTVRYEIHDIPVNVEIERQLIELSEEESFEVGKSFELSGNKRSITFEHLYTNRSYYYRVTAYLSDGNEITASSQFKTAETPRIISTEGVWNMRDIGGTKTLDGRTLKQGLVYRGVELDGAVYEKYCITETGAKVLTEELGIRTEMDLRGPKDNMRDMLGSDVNHYIYDSVYAYSDSLATYYLENYRQLFSDLANEENYPIYIHCSYGKDRTGTVIYLLQLLLGVSEEDAYSEWELSVLLDGVLDYEPMRDYIAALKELEGDTMQEKVVNHLLSIGVTKEEIETIRSILIEDYVSDYKETSAIGDD